MERHTRTAGDPRRPLALLMAGLIALAGMTVTTAPADANPTPPIEVTAAMRGCPAQGSTPAHVYVWLEPGAVGDDLDLHAVRIRFRLKGTTSWSFPEDAGVFLSAFAVLRFDNVGSTDAIEVEYDVRLTGANSYQNTFTALPDIPITIPSSVALASLGSGTAGDPYRISTPQHLDDMGCLIYRGTSHFVLENDLYMTDDGTPSGNPVPFLPLGGGDNYTSASLDGRGHAIHGLVIDRPKNDRVGLFSNTDGLVVRDLRIVAPQVTGGTRVGALGGSVRGASISRLTVEDAVVRFTALSDNSSRYVGGIAGFVEGSYISDVRWSADVRPLPPVWPIDPASRAQPDIEMADIGGFTGEARDATKMQRAHGAVTIALEGSRVSQVGGLAGRSRRFSDFDDVTLDAAITVKASSMFTIAGAFGGDFEDGVTLRDATVHTDIVLEGVPGTTMNVREIGGIAAKAEHATFRRVDVSGTLLVDATEADGGASLSYIGGFAGLAKPAGLEATTVTESRSTVDVTVRAGRTDVRLVGALYGRSNSAPGTTQDVLVTGSVVIESDRDTPPSISKVGGLVGEFGTSSSRTMAHLSRVIWRGGLTIDGLSGEELLAAVDGTTLADVGALLGTDEGAGGQRSHCVFWDVANGFTGPDTLMPGSPRTAAQLVALLDGDCGFTTGFVQDSGAPVAWCLDDDGQPAITALTTECGSTTIVQQVAPTAPAGLRFACVPLQAVPGDRITCFATGADPNIEILWSASASPAFAGGPVTTNALGDLAFTFLVPSDMEGATIGVELVAWTAPVLIRIGAADSAPVGTDEGQGAPVGTDDGQGPRVPTSVPAGDGGPVWTASTILVLLALLGTILRLVGLDPLARIRAARTTPQPNSGALGAG